jgi:hypothetical protein
MNMNARFVPWARFATHGTASLAVRAGGRDVPVTISRYGPGDVTGISPGQVRRRDPLPNSLSFSPNLFPSVEFSSPDFPWAMSAGTPNVSGQLQPWGPGRQGHPRVPVSSSHGGH